MNAEERRRSGYETPRERRVREAEDVSPECIIKEKAFDKLWRGIQNKRMKDSKIRDREK